MKRDPLTRLTPKQQIAAAHYLAHGDQTQAYKAAYPKRNAKEESYRKMAARLFAEPAMKAYLAAQTEKILKPLEITAERTLQEIARLAYTDISEICEWEHGELRVLDSGKLNAHQRAAIRKIRQDQRADGTGHLEVELTDKLAALKTLALYQGLFEKQAKETPEIAIVINV